MGKLAEGFETGGMDEEVSALCAGYVWGEEGS
jgi:hypothetical protein